MRPMPGNARSSKVPGAGVRPPQTATTASHQRRRWSSILTAESFRPRSCIGDPRAILTAARSPTTTIGAPRGGRMVIRRRTARRDRWSGLYPSEHAPSPSSRRCSPARRSPPRPTTCPPCAPPPAPLPSPLRAPPASQSLAPVVPAAAAAAAVAAPAAPFPGRPRRRTAAPAVRAGCPPACRLRPDDASIRPRPHARVIAATDRGRRSRRARDPPAAASASATRPRRRAGPAAHERPRCAAGGPCSTGVGRGRGAWEAPVSGGGGG
jgi:hypothetical protein